MNRSDGVIIASRERISKRDYTSEKGTHIGYVEAAILAGMGVAKVPVYRQPRIVLLTTGDEVVELGIPLPEGKIYNSNMTMLSARLRELGIESFHMEAVKDDPTVMSEKLKKQQKRQI